MICKINDKPTMLVAGAGAGKTHDMIKRIVEAIPELRPNRMLAAITFTNAATESIKQRLQSKMQIPPNVFVGTNYSFFNHFIFLPFAELFQYTIKDKLFLEIDIREIVSRITKGNCRPEARKAIRARIQKKLLNEGKIPFEQIAQISAQLMAIKDVRRIVCNKIQFLFKDEFQDTDTVQLKIFEAIRLGKRTKMYSVGDPEQYILGFTYDLRGVKKPPFNKIPINRFGAGCNKHQITANRRACEKIVKFTNNFHTSIKQVSQVIYNEPTGVFFILNTDLDLVISKFLEMTQGIIDACITSRRFFLGYENKTFNSYKEKYGLTPISNEHSQSKSILNDALELITVVTQLNIKVLAEKYDLSPVELRKCGIKLMKAIASESIVTTDNLISYLKGDPDLGFSVGSEPVDFNFRLGRLKSLLSEKDQNRKVNFYSSIHKAKGLEADCALMVAKNNDELRKWLETDYDRRCQDRSDSCRIGYVGFTRAKKMLCIACKESLDSSVEKKLKELAVISCEASGALYSKGKVF